MHTASLAVLGPYIVPGAVTPCGTRRSSVETVSSCGNIIARLCHNFALSTPRVIGEYALTQDDIRGAKAYVSNKVRKAEIPTFVMVVTKD